MMAVAAPTATPVPEFLAEFRKQKRAAPAGGCAAGPRAPVSRESAELAMRELRLLVGQQITPKVLCGADATPQLLSPTVSAPSSPETVPTPPKSSGLHDHSLEPAATTTTATSHGIHDNATTGGACATREHGHPTRDEDEDEDDDIGGFFSRDVRRRRQMMSMLPVSSTDDESDESSSESDSSDDEDVPESVPPSSSTRHQLALHQRIGRRSRATILSGGLLAACWASKMIARTRARRAGRRVGARSHAPLIPQKWLESPRKSDNTVQALEQGAYQAYLKLQMIEEKELSLSTAERILVEFPVWLLAPAAMIIYMLLFVSETYDGQGEL